MNKCFIQKLTFEAPTYSAGLNRVTILTTQSVVPQIRPNVVALTNKICLEYFFQLHNVNKFITLKNFKKHSKIRKTKEKLSTNRYLSSEVLFY